MHESIDLTYTSFDGARRIASGPLEVNALAVKKALEKGAVGPLVIFDDNTGRSIDVDLRGSDAEIAARLTSTLTKNVLLAAETPESLDSSNDPARITQETKGRGRPRLGVTAREVTLLPRHWEWLASQPGGASVALRKLVEQARRSYSDKDKTRKAQDRTFHFLSVTGGNQPGFEEAIRALFANDPVTFKERIKDWPKDVREHANRLAFEGATKP